MPTTRPETARMIRAIESEYGMTRGLTGRDHLPPAIREALIAVPRHEFVPADMRSLAYDNTPLPIGRGQTISQPYIVALMTDLIDPRPEHRVLEVGCGSGYQAAVLATLVAQVYTTEILPELAAEAEARLRRFGYTNVTVESRDGYYGWQEHAPYDGILVTAAAVEIPPPLIDQLRPGGRMVIPVGPPHRHQELVLVVKDEDATVRCRSVLGVAFVPLTGGHGSERETFWRR